MVFWPLCGQIKRPTERLFVAKGLFFWLKNSAFGVKKWILGYYLLSFVCVIPACTQDFGTGGGSWYYKVSSKRMRNKEVQVIPWVIGDSSFVRCSTSRMVTFFLLFPLSKNSWNELWNVFTGCQQNCVRWSSSWYA